jgi:hypothetical protein
MRIEEIRSDLGLRLRARRDEIEAAMLTRVYGVAEPIETSDPEYAHGLKIAVNAALDYGFNALERAEERPPPIPTVLLAQARLAARAGVNLDTVLRRYFAGYTLLGDFVIEEAGGMGLKGGSLRRPMRTQAVLFDRVVVAVSEEYGREQRAHLGSAELRRADRIKRLLEGELLDISELGYELRGHHIGVIATGSGAADALHDRAKSLDRRLLVVRGGEGLIWAWLGGRREIGAEEIENLIERPWPAGVALGVGEPGEGIAGWRLTHRQARAAFQIALHGDPGAVRYTDVTLLAAVLGDDLLATSLRDLYLHPLNHERDGGKAARETLRAYFAAGGNISSAAATLDVKRHTVTSRLRAIEQQLGRALGDCTSELDLALRLEELGEPLLPGEPSR